MGERIGNGRKMWWKEGGGGGGRRTQRYENIERMNDLGILRGRNSEQETQSRPEEERAKDKVREKISTSRRDRKEEINLYKTGMEKERALGHRRRGTLMKEIFMPFC